MSEGFITDIHTAELFFRFCRRYGIETREDRLALMREITKRGKAKYLRDPQEFLEGKSALYIKPKRSHNEN